MKYKILREKNYNDKIKKIKISKDPFQKKEDEYYQKKIKIV